MSGWTLPERTLSRMLLRRSLAFWPGVRLLVVVPLLLLAAAAGEPVSPGLLVAPIPLISVPVVAALAVLETRRRHEHLLFANLGTGPAGVAALAVAPPLLGEAVLLVLVGA
jgi:hypothetical protein